MATKDNTAFAQAHPELVERYGDLDWLNKYTDYKDGKINERWERDANGVLVDVTAREKAYEELEDAQEELERLRRKELNDDSTLMIRGRVTTKL